MPTPEVIDTETRKKLELLYPDFRVRIIRVYNDFFNLHKRKLRSTEGLRDFQRQAELYAQGRTTPGKKVTDAKPGESIHHYGCAVDTCFNSGDPFLEQIFKRNPKEYEFLWSEFGRFARAYGLVWGGDWNGNGVHDKNDYDLVHCQITYGQTLKQIQELYHFGGLRAVWAKFDKIRGVEVGEGWLNKLS